MSQRVSCPIVIGATWVIALLVGAAIGAAITSAIVGRQSTERARSDFNARISAAREEAKTAVEKAVNEANIAIATARTETEKAIAEMAKTRAARDKAVVEAAKARAEGETIAAEAAKARANADKAVAETDKARADADMAVAETAKARADRDKAVAEAANARAEGEKAVAEAAGANERVAELEREAAKSRTEKEELKANLGWRALTPTVAAHLTAALATNPSQVTILYANGDTEALYLALQMSNLFAKASWQVTMLGVTMQGTIIYGVSVPDSSWSATATIRGALNSANVEFVMVDLPPRSMESQGDTIDNAAVLFVGSKPLPR